MTARMAAIREVFGIPDVFTVRPSTFGEIDPVAEAAAELLTNFRQSCMPMQQQPESVRCETTRVFSKSWNRMMVSQEGER